MYGTLQRNVESSPGSVLGRLVGESGRAEDGGRGEQESESSGPEHVDESKWEARVADADAVSDVDEPEVNGVVRESRFSLAILYTPSPPVCLRALSLATHRTRGCVQRLSRPKTMLRHAPHATGDPEQMVSTTVECKKEGGGSAYAHGRQRT